MASHLKFSAIDQTERITWLVFHSGVVRALVEPYLQMAQEEGIAVYLEASNTHARDVYSHLSFRTVEEVVVGKGEVDEDGSLVAGGQGVTLYAMIAEPLIVQDDVAPYLT